MGTHWRLSLDSHHIWGRATRLLVKVRGWQWLGDSQRIWGGWSEFGRRLWLWQGDPPSIRGWLPDYLWSSSRSSDVSYLFATSTLNRQQLIWFQTWSGKGLKIFYALLFISPSSPPFTFTFTFTWSGKGLKIFYALLFIGPSSPPFTFTFTWSWKGLKIFYALLFINPSSAPSLESCLSGLCWVLFSMHPNAGILALVAAR